ncbi:MAG: hypothetical protein ACRC8Z_03905 [Empedobacter falsenii]
MKKPEKKSIYWEDVVKEIQKFPATQFKHFIPHWIYINETNISCLIQAGFKVSRGDWDGVMKDVLIIEW